MPDPAVIHTLLTRFGGATPEMLGRILSPYRLKLTAIEVRPRGKGAIFEATVPADVWTTLEVGTTGKIVPREHVEEGGPWREVIKARIMSTGPGVVTGELYFVPPARLALALRTVRIGDYMEIDPFGVTSKIESALCEAAFFTMCQNAGFAVTRMPENVAMHVGTQNYYDFRLERDGRVYRVELKSLWGTDTTKARLIHTVSRDGGGKNSARGDRQVWASSSCRFKDQDIFALSMWLRTGRITDFAFALSVSDTDCPDWGLPRVAKHPGHVTQNPAVPDPPSAPWTTDINVICAFHDDLRRGCLAPRPARVDPAKVDVT